MPGEVKGAFIRLGLAAVSAVCLGIALDSPAAAFALFFAIAALLPNPPNEPPSRE